MGLFNNYTKEGPGVRKDEKRKKGFARYFEILFRHYGELLKLNLWFLLCSLPFILVLGFSYLSFAIGYIISPEGQIYMGMVLLCLALLVVSAIPIGSAFTAVHAANTRFLRDEPFFAWHRFKDDYKKNFKQSAPVGIALAVVTVVQCIALLFYIVSGNANIILTALCLLSLLILFGATQTIFMQIQYLDLGLGAIIKNSLLIFFGKAKRMLPSALIQLVIVLAIAVTLVIFPLASWIILLIIGVPAILLISDMWAWKVVDELFNIEAQLQERKDNELKEIELENMQKIAQARAEKAEQNK